MDELRKEIRRLLWDSFVSARMKTLRKQDMEPKGHQRTLLEEYYDVLDELEILKGTAESMRREINLLPREIHDAYTLPIIGRILEELVRSVQSMRDRVRKLKVRLMTEPFIDTKVSELFGSVESRLVEFAVLPEYEMALFDHDKLSPSKFYPTEEYLRRLDALIQAIESVIESLFELIDEEKKKTKGTGELRKNARRSL